MDKIKKIYKKFAFTVAELMIVLTVIGILSAILLPAAFNTTPDQNIIKFKKANTTLATVIRELSSSGQYYVPGMLGIIEIDDGAGGTVRVRPGMSASDAGNVSYFIPASMIVNAVALKDLNPPMWTNLIDTVRDPIKHFCNAFADTLSIKSKKCDILTPDNNLAVSLTTFDATSIVEIAKLVAEKGRDTEISLELDSVCMERHPARNTTSTGESIFPIHVIAQDDIVYYFPTILFFGKIPILAGDRCDASEDIYTMVDDGFGHLSCHDINGNDIAYQMMCIDIDGNGPILPFGYGIRSDGKILAGARAQWWLSRDIVKKDDEPPCPLPPELCDPEE